MKKCTFSRTTVFGLNRRESCYPLIHSENACKTQDWVRPKLEAYSSIQLDLVFPRSWQSPSHLSHRPLPSHRFYEQEARTEWSWESHTRWQGSARLLCPMLVPILSDLDIGSLVEAFSGSGWSLPLVVLRGLHLLPGVTGFGNSIKNWLLVCALGRIWMKALKWLDLRGGRGRGEEDCSRDCAQVEQASLASDMHGAF